MSQKPPEPTPVTENGVHALYFEDCARLAYAAYGAVTSFKNFRGDPMPSWDDLPLSIRTAWEAATRQAMKSYLYRGMNGKEWEDAVKAEWQSWESPTAK